MLHRFIDRRPVDDLACSGRRLLSQILVYFHDNIVGHTSTFLRSCGSSAGRSHHYPNLSTADGLQQLFCLLTVVELDELLFSGLSVDSEYLGKDKRGQLRDFVREIIDVLDRCIRVHRRGSAANVGVLDLWISFLVQQCVALHSIARRRQISSQLLAELEAAISQGKHALYGDVGEMVKDLLGGTSCVFGGTVDFKLEPGHCEGFDWAFRDIIDLSRQLFFDRLQRVNGRPVDKVIVRV
ncbi:hypothetical protein VNI00_011531 [Paramarasmius palmivorus]|uniref:Uncharacterized protein n=1 Tax=Paramarasmius palmivorus TaxID=297713 RepID=A0AAW0CEA0_9AGAR